MTQAPIRPESRPPNPFGIAPELKDSLGQRRSVRIVAQLDRSVAGPRSRSYDVVCRSLPVLIVSALAISILASSRVAAQNGFTGGLTGVITDPSGGVLPDVTVEITNERTGKVERSIKSEADGSYSATLLPPGTYSLRVEVANFKQSLIAGVPVRSNETSRQDVKVEIGNITEQCESWRRHR